MPGSQISTLYTMFVDVRNYSLRIAVMNKYYYDAADAGKKASKGQQMPKMRSFECHQPLWRLRCAPPKVKEEQKDSQESRLAKFLAE
ncbi:hypothetical protein AVEN_118780-1 [Araneus ventricosus]|uniref:Uncharacterized protein n=1 Tax=Araneus ventricosus TaxID=182803 RepID=A0A4Y2BXP1_ARAVE|nr:hypothetical protein AVEN_118780-1 [Araneus ventricosus]